MRRWHMQRHGLAIQAAYDDAGLAYLESLRMLRPDLFRHARIKDVLQLNPSDLPTGVVYRIGGEVLGEPWRVTGGAA